MALTSRHVSATIAITPATSATRPSAKIAEALPGPAVAAHARLSQTAVLLATLPRVAVAAHVSVGQAQTLAASLAAPGPAVAASASNGLPRIWSAGQPLPTDLVFSGPAGRLAMDASGSFQSFGLNLPRYAIGNTYVPASGGTLVPAWLIEGASSNIALGSNLFADGTRWSGNTDFTITPATSCIAGQTAYLHTNLGASAFRTRGQTVGTFVSGQTDCLWFILEPPGSNAATTARLTIFDNTAGADLCGATYTWSTNIIAVTSGAGTCGVIDIGNGRRLIYVAATGTAAGTGAAGHARGALVFPTGSAQNTQACIVHHGQFEPAAALPSSPIITVGAAASRSGEQAHLPFPYTPGALALYTQFVNRGVVATANGRLWQIGNGAGNTNSLRVIGTGRNLSVINDDGAASVSASTVLDAYTFGDSLEIAGRLYADGSVDVVGAANGGAVTASARSAAKALPGAWAGQNLYIAANGSAAFGNMGLQSLKVALGVTPTMDQMRAFT